MPSPTSHTSYPSHPVPSPWTSAIHDKPDADILVLAYSTKSDTWWLASFDGEQWHELVLFKQIPVTHWMHLPEGPLEN